MDELIQLIIDDATNGGNNYSVAFDRAIGDIVWRKRSTHSPRFRENHVVFIVRK